ncbi:TIR domain-containing protein [Winogradskyella psychrotolerans]|uniref:TIR domain-containing protein n=1 Tax=Winogradskyella psychrotolerans TaxID=1344585 RepID=UPI001C07C21F|nr:TIR domain-containing protein [Winogradskyella psychrotolerans]MBU2928223.1 toll/interleukin-1 receptor domain-containing protein [Winogradskyella psychrotolerans]
MKFFISYTTKDKNITKDLLIQVYNELSEFENVYIDLIHNDSVNKQKRVFEELESADQIILIETESVYESNWVKVELERAKHLKKEIIKIPFNELVHFLERKLNSQTEEKSQWLTTYIKNSASRC